MATETQDVLPASYGGPGWEGRAASHAEDVSAGELWHRCGVRSEVAPLREVLLSWPSDRLAEITDPNAWLMVEPIDLEAIRAQAEQVVAFFEAQGVRVQVHRPEAPPPPNYLFMRDLVFMTPEGAVLCRPAGAVRAAEARFAAQALAERGIPILRTLRGGATFEGADALWLDARTVLVGMGQRTNPEGLAQLRSVLSEQRVQLLSQPLPAGVQHLLGVMVPLDEDLVLLHGGHATIALRAFLRSRRITCIELEADAELTEKLGMNGVTLGPRRFVMPSGCPGIRARLEEEGVEVFELDVSQYVRAAGALGCLTSILRRGAPDAPAC